MKKKSKIIIAVIILLVLLIPVPTRYKDGGSVRYRAVLYRLMNKQQIYDYLNQENVWYEITEHEAVYNMAD